jgi:deoxyribodipyrimidine photo-lyase
MRMDGAKKIIKWTESHKTACQTIITLNDKYFFDGRDANSYTVVAWIFGKHDRAWPERPIFGKLGYMNEFGSKKKIQH